MPEQPKPDTITQALALRRLTGLESLSAPERALLTPEVITRWTESLGSDDVVEATQLVRLERRRRTALATIRDGALVTDMEFQVWRLLQRHEGRTVTFAELMRALWPDETRGVSQSTLWRRDGLYGRYVSAISKHVSNLKRKLEIDPKRPQHLISEPGVGYRWYSSPPSRDDGEDYAARSEQARQDRIEIRGHRGELPPPRDEVGRFGPGPEHPDHPGTAIEGEVVQSVTRRGRRP